MTDVISTSPLALQALKVVRWLDQLLGPVEAQAFMLRTNEMLGTSPVQAIKERRFEDVLRSVQAVAVQQGLFAEPWLPPQRSK